MTRAFTIVTALAAVFLASPRAAIAQSVTSEQLNAPLGSDPIAVAALLRRLQRAAAQSADADHAGATSRSLPRSGRSKRACSASSRRRRSSSTAILYVTGPNNTAWALDARTGRQIWSYRRDLPDGLDVCCGRVNRGFAALGNRLFMATLDAHLLAFDMKTGVDRLGHGHRRLQEGLHGHRRAARRQGQGAHGHRRGGVRHSRLHRRVRRCHRASAHGASGRCPVRARRAARRGKAKSWERGGGSTWVTGTYDPALNLVYWGTGNPGPDLYGDDREGDNLYTDSVVALDPDTGVLKWHYQFTPHDVHDWDATQVPVLADTRSTACARRRSFWPTGTGSSTRSIGPTAPLHRLALVREDDVGGEDRRRWKPVVRPAAIRVSRERTCAPTSRAAPTGCRRPTTRRPA